MLYYRSVTDHLASVQCRHCGERYTKRVPAEFEGEYSSCDSCLAHFRRQARSFMNVVKRQCRYWDPEEKAITYGEAALALAVVESAIEDLVYFDSSRPENTKDFLSAKRFVFSSGLDPWLEPIGINATWVREKADAWLKAMRRKGIEKVV